MEHVIDAIGDQPVSAAREIAARYDELLRRDGPALRRVAASYEADAARAEDLFQEICLAVWQALPRFRGDSSERTFVFRIAHNRGLSHRSRRRPPGDDLDAAAELPAPGPSPEAAAHASERREQLRAAVRALPLPLEQVLTLALEGLSTKEIGEVLGITDNNAAVRLTRARQALRRALGGGPGDAR